MIYVRSAELDMYKYDIRLPQEGEYALCYSDDGITWSNPLNVSKKKWYLKSKMKAHRDEMISMGYNGKAYYRIEDHLQKVISTQIFQEGEKGGSTEPYSKEAPKPKTNYVKAYVYEYFGEIVTEERHDAFPITSFDVICDDDGKVLTDLKLLQLLCTFLYEERIPLLSHKPKVSIATYLPLSKETFVKLPGCGEKTFDKYGDRIIEFLKSYLATVK